MWIILLDHSGSMGDPFTGKQTFAGRSKASTAAMKLDAAKNALLEHLLGLGSPGKMALIEFTSTASVVFEGVSSDLSAVQQVLATLHPDDGTDIAVALERTTAYVHTIQEEFVIRVLVITDGLSDREKAEVAARKLVAQGAIIDLILIDPTDQGEIVARAIASSGSVTGVHSAQELSDTVAIAKELERRQTEEATRLIRAYEEEQAGVTEKVLPEERLSFTAGYPDAVSPERWYPLLVYLHVAGRKEMVEQMLQQRSAALGFEPSVSTTKASSPMRRETRLSLTPRIEHCRFNPPTQDIIWYEDIQEVDFRLWAETDGASRTLPGSVDIHVGPLLIASLPLSVTVRVKGAGEAQAELAIETARIFNSIFVSYAHTDTPLIEACLAAYGALGIAVYRAAVVPLVSGTVERVIAQAREDVASAIAFLEETTGLRYYPVPTLLVDRYAVTSVREHLTVDFSEDDTDQKNRALALADVLNSICPGFHTRSFFPRNRQDISFNERDAIFGKDRVLSGVAFDLVRRQCEASIHQWVEAYFASEHNHRPGDAPDWRQTRDDLLRLNMGEFQPDLDFAGFLSAFLRIVNNLLRVGLQRLGTFPHESDYTVQRRSWQLLREEIPDLSLGSKHSRYRNDSVHLDGQFEEFVRAFGIVSERLVEAIHQSTYLASPTRRFFTTQVPTYGIYVPPDSLSTETALRQWAFEHGIPAQLTLPRSPRILLCLDACQRGDEQLKQEGVHARDRAELAALFQRCVLVHEHFHAILEVGLDRHHAPALGVRSGEAWRAASRVNEAMAVWMELHFARTLHRSDLMELVLSYIQAGSYPRWPYRGAEYLENLYQRRGIEPVRQLILSLRQTPEVALAQLERLKAS